MSQRMSERVYGPIALLLLAAGIVLAEFLWQGPVGFSLWDEGFLWYGVQRVMLGEVPIRDFWAYDPGRYYWSAAIMGLRGDNGIMALRGAVAIFQTIGLFVGLWLIVRALKKQNLFYLLLSAVTLTVWMFPRHKLFDISLSILLIGALAFLIQNPTSRRYFFTGMVVGLAAVFGRNHGVYGVAGSIGVMLWLRIKPVEGSGLIKGFALWTAGVTVGFMPVIFMALRVPGFASAFWENSILFLFEAKATNHTLPTPWPWLVNFASVPLGEAIRGVLIGLFFLVIVVFGVAGIIWVVRRRLSGIPVQPVVVASAFMTLPYAHHAFSRADISHLAQSIFPFLLGSLVLLADRPPKIKWPFAVLLCSVSLLVMLPVHPGWQCYASRQWVETDVAGSKLIVDPGTAKDLALLNKLAEEFAPGQRSFIAVPFWPGAYAVLGRKAPMWEIFMLFSRNEAFQQAEIARIKAADPGFAVVLNAPLDGMEERRFQNTRPVIDRYIRESFEPVSDYSQNSDCRIYRSKQITPATD